MQCSYTYICIKRCHSRQKCIRRNQELRGEGWKFPTRSTFQEVWVPRGLNVTTSSFCFVKCLPSGGIAMQITPKQENCKDQSSHSPASPLLCQYLINESTTYTNSTAENVFLNWFIGWFPSHQTQPLHLQKLMASRRGLDLRANRLAVWMTSQ